MTQTATVTAITGPGTVEVTVARKTACGHDCENCGGCGAQGGKLTVRAACRLAVEPGDLVEVYSGKKVLAYAALVYLLPMALFLVGCFIPVGASPAVRYLCGGAGFVLGLAAAVVCDRQVKKKNTITYQVVRKL